MSTTSILIIIIILIAIALIALKIISTKKQLPEIISPTSKRKLPIENSKRKLPIEKLYDFLNRNLENDGIHDALVNGDIKHCQQKLRELKERGKQECDKTDIEYKREIIAIEATIKTNISNGYEDLANKLKIQQDQHKIDIESIPKIKTDLENEEFSSIESEDFNSQFESITSYRRGFLKQKRANAEAQSDDLIRLRTLAEANTDSLITEREG